jgi:acyl-CoA synthetase (AMP-forming)/AMP-acid ligase II
MTDDGFVRQQNPTRQEILCTPPVHFDDNAGANWQWLTAQKTPTAVLLAQRCDGPIDWELHQAALLDAVLRWPVRNPKARVVLAFPADEALLAAVAIVAALYHGNTVWPIDRNLTAAEQSSALVDFGATHIVVGKGDGAKLDEAAKKGRRVVAVEMAADGRNVRYAGASALEGGFAPPRGGSLVLRTSGTTGDASAVRVTWAQLAFNAVCIGTSLRLTAADVSLTVMPLFHIGGIACGLLAPLLMGSRVVFIGAFDPHAAFDALTTARSDGMQPTWIYAAPTLLRALELYATGKGATVTQLRFIRTGAAAMDHDTAQRLRRVFLCPVVLSYSMTECMPIASVPVDWDLRMADTVGPPIGPSVCIVRPRLDESADVTDWQPLPYGENGEVCVRGPGVAAIGLDCDGWFRTGDLGALDRGTGYLRLLGRLKETIKYGGEQISLTHVERELARALGTSASFVLAFPVRNAFWGEELAVAVTPTHVDGAVSTASMQRLVHEAAMVHLAPIARPKQVFVFAGAAEQERLLPRTPTGKFLRFQCANALGLVAVDNAALKALTAMATDESPAVSPPPSAQLTAFDADDDALLSAGGRGVRPSEALAGIRIFLAYLVVQNHVGVLHSKAWDITRQFSPEMIGFFFLAGFQLAANATAPILPRDRFAFLTARLGALHGAFVFALAYSLPLYVYVCYPGSVRCTWIVDRIGVPLTLVGYALSALSFAAGIFTITWFMLPFVLSVFWFQGALYALTLLFPALDCWIRRLAGEHQGPNASAPWIALSALLGASIAASMAVVPFAHWIGIAEPNDERMTSLFVSWLPVFVLGICMWYTFKRVSWTIAHYPWLWAIAADGLTLVIASIVVLAVVIEPRSYEEWRSESNLSNVGRFRTPLHTMLWSQRWGTSVIASWFFALAAGRGATAWFLSRPLFARRLAPLTYPLYMLHPATAGYFYVAVPQWQDQQHPAYVSISPLYPFQLPWWMLFVVLAVSLVLGALFNEFVNPWLLPYMVRYWRFLLRIYSQLLCSCGLRCFGEPQRADLNALPTSPDTEECDRFETPVEVTLRAIRELTGTDVHLDTCLWNAGLTSIGTTALSGMLRCAIPHAPRISPFRLQRCDTVADVVRLVEASYS